MSTLNNLIRRFTILSPLLLLLLASSAVAGGNPVFEFLRIPMNARAAALGGTFLTVRNDPAVLFYNPGGLSTLEKPSASAGFVKHLLDINAGYVTYAQQYDDIGYVSAGVVYLNAGSFEKTDRFAQSAGTFGAADLAVTVGYANTYEQLHYGASAKVIYSYIDTYNASGLALDLGAQYYIPSEQLSLGISVLNLGTQLSSFGAEKEQLPLDVKLGVSKRLEHLPLTVMLNFHKLTESRDDLLSHFSSFSLGGEFQFSEAFRARVGYNNEMRRELKIGTTAGLAGFAAGFGLTIASYGLDYAFTSFGKIGALHRVSLGTTF
jgi:long-subunit fatty acid transport protein